MTFSIGLTRMTKNSFFLRLWPFLWAIAHYFGVLGQWRGVNSTNVLYEGLRIGEIGRRMNSKVKLVEIGVYRK
jgi:hypothetical protein